MIMPNERIVLSKASERAIGITPELASILKEHDIRIHTSEITQHAGPPNPDISGSLDPQGRKVLGDLMDRAQAYLNGIYIEDNFGNTFEGRQKRNNFWSRQESKFGEAAIRGLQERDKMKVGASIGTTKAYFEWFVIELQKTRLSRDIVSKFQELYEEFLLAIPLEERTDNNMRIKETYQDSSFTDKLIVIGKVDAVVKKLLDLITTDNLKNNRVDANQPV